MRSLAQTSIRTRILILPLLFSVGLVLLQGAGYLLEERIKNQVVFPEFEGQMLAGHQNALQALVESEALSLGEAIKGVEGKAERFAVIEKRTDPQRFFADKSGYFFAYDLAGTRINVPVNKSGNGKNFIDLKDQKGGLFIQEMVTKAKAGGGFVEYYFEKPGKGVQPKLSYVKLVPGADVFVGTGVYIDNVVEERDHLRAKVDGKSAEYGVYKIAFMLAIFLLIMVLSLLVVRSITGAIKSVITGLSESSDQVATSSGQLSSTSQRLAEGSSQQAASLEETSSSLEEITAMVRQNADNASQANLLARETNQVMDKANQAMDDLNLSINQISQAGEQTGKIIKTIDEIAFQTNLLALNAAVEAARAGEAGAGFAVVAEEVRNLAMRAAEAAKNTATLIEDTIKKTAEGTGLVARTAEAFGEVRGRAGKVGELVGEIAAASNEQAQGITQINTAMSQVDKVTQEMAANAQEAAAASEVLNSQAGHMAMAVGALSRLVSGGSPPDRALKPGRRVRAAEAVAAKALTTSVPRRAAKASPSLAPGRQPEKVIPLDDDFKDF